MTDQLPALQVLIPLLGAPLCVLVRSRAAACALFAIASVGALACAVWLAAEVESEGVQRYAMGGWSAPAGIEFVVADFNTPILLIVSLVATVVALYSPRSVASEIDEDRASLFYACMCLTLAGLIGLTITGDAFNAFVFLEISSLSTYALIAMGRSRRSLLASYRYLIVGTVGATFVLLGIGLAYALTGTLNMADLQNRLGDVEQGNRALYAAVVFVFIGLAIKMALFPLHAWLPGAYGEAPSAVSVLLSATSTKVAIYVFVRFAFTVFGVTLVFRTMPMDQVGLTLAVLAMLVGSAVACLQSDLKYLLAWSSVGQIGYIVAGISLGTEEGVSAGYLHMINHALIKGAMFAAAGLLLLRLGTSQLRALDGLGRRMPWTFAALVIGGLGLIGVPPTAGFVSKWALARALVEEDQWVVLGALLVSSLLAVVYVGRVVEAIWFRAPPSDTSEQPSGLATRRAPVTMAAAIAVLVGASVYFGVDPRLTGEIADAAAAALLGTGSG
jgi:multicomponent Na+:H+ antiporter subunit D